MGGFPQAETETIVLQREGGSSFVGGAVMGDGDDHSPVFPVESSEAWLHFCTSDMAT